MLLLYLAKKGLSITTFSRLTLILSLCTPENVNNGLIPKNYIAQFNSYRNARITTIFEFVEKLDFTYFVWNFTLVITNFRALLRL